MLAAPDLRFVAGLLDADTDMHVLVWADSPEAVRLTAAGYPRDSRHLDVLAERGGPGGRTGARTLEQSLATAQAVHQAPNLHLAGIAAWEGSLAVASGPKGSELLREFCEGAADTSREALRSGMLSAEVFALVGAEGAARSLTPACAVAAATRSFVNGQPAQIRPSQTWQESIHVRSARLGASGGSSVKRRSILV